MSSCYYAICLDEFNWNYINRSKQTLFDDLLDIAGYEAVVVGEWYGAVVLDLDKRVPFGTPLFSVLYANCDHVYIQTDNMPQLKQLNGEVR